jgi:hypothetical protein
MAKAAGIPTFFLGVRMPIPIHDGIVNLASTLNVDKTVVVTNAVVYYLQKCGHDESLLRELLAEKKMREEYLVLKESNRLLQEDKDRLAKSLEIVQAKLDSFKVNEDEKVKDRVRAANESSLKPNERADLEKAKILAMRPGPFQDGLKSLADQEARGLNPHLLKEPTTMQLLLRRAYGSYTAAIDSILKVVA